MFEYRDLGLTWNCRICNHYFHNPDIINKDPLERPKYRITKCPRCKSTKIKKIWLNEIPSDQVDSINQVEFICILCKKAVKDPVNPIEDLTSHQECYLKWINAYANKFNKDHLTKKDMQLAFAKFLKKEKKEKKNLKQDVLFK